jgi:hypothetical protein
MMVVTGPTPRLGTRFSLANEIAPTNESLRQKAQLFREPRPTKKRPFALTLLLPG